MKKNSSRRKFIASTFQSGIAVGLLSNLPKGVMASTINDQPMFKQTTLPYAYQALEPVIDALTMEIHYTKHAAAYTKNLNEAAAAELKGKSLSLEEILNNISSYSVKMRNNGGGHYNHELFWQSMQAPGTPLHEGVLKSAITKTFGSYDNFKAKMSEAAMTRFGSGWAWLYLDEKKALQIGSTPNQDNPLMDASPIKGFPLLGLDVWEHAYYLKYQNKRAEYVNNWFNLVNWKFVEERFEKYK
ncbi:MAG: superoxide dismutase [bacterium]|jgi:Fe-Mn family superoxide dismutase